MGIPVPEELRPTGSALSAPPRRPGSVRRTSTMEFGWPDGLGGDTVLDGRARDLLTLNDGSARGVAEARLAMVSDARRVIRSITSTPHLPLLQGLLGASAMSGFRGRLAEARATDSASPLHLLLDDVPGATLVSGSAFQRWYEPERYRDLKADVARRVMTDVCTGYQSGSSALHPDGTLIWRQNRVPAADIKAVNDDLAWHTYADPTGVSMRRARRIDVWIDGPTIRVDAFFQDSSTLPDGGRQAIHEYGLTARADLRSQTLRHLTPVAHVLPYDECPLAVRNVSALIGLPLGGLRRDVLKRLPGPLGCTHLNDMLRSLADAPALAALVRSDPPGPRPPAA
ncbi:DUF2889 domain-containing protein [Streptomyces sp. NPDC056656]|uniref:DUF2889 domain-containing protein n=1 Tax=Streptomyces sp. NPDC056656 TaxID=3345895 RepID=UPI0036A4ADBE